LLADPLISSNPANGYVIADGIRLLATNSTNSSQAGIFYVHNDHLGTPRVITDDQQTVVWQAHYDPFGKASITTETIVNNIRFPGQYFDAESGLYYNYYRYYDPTTGRYITSDPIGLAGGLNTYGYVDGNPLGFIDPFGLAGTVSFFELIFHSSPVGEGSDITPLNCPGSGNTMLFRATSKSELDDINSNGLRTTPGQFETGKLFATSLDDAAKFGKNNFKLVQQTVSP